MYKGFVDLLTAAPIEAEIWSEYLLNNYPKMWAAAPSDDPRTTNAVESFHSHHNWSFYHAHPHHIHMVIGTLQSIQVTTDLKLNLIWRGRMNPRGNDNDPRRAVLKNV